MQNYYDYYWDYKGNSDINNAVQIVHINNEGEVFVREIFELCPKCRDEFISWIKKGEMDG